MTEPPRLAAAQARLRRPGRPRKTPPEPRARTAAPRPAPALTPVSPAAARLLDVEHAALYLGLSVWTVRALLDAGTLRRVRVPSGRGAELRKVLIDRADLDALIEAWKS